MIKIILHIGRHKSGTSSLQRFLYENSNILESNNFVYPEVFLRGIAHHHLSETLSRGALKDLSADEIDFRLNQVRAVLEKCINDPNKTYVFSSEAFQNCDPKVIRAVFDSAIFDVNVVCYFRDQVSYFVSAYNQKVHATHYSQTPESFFKASFKADYYNFSCMWADSFPSFNARIFDKHKLVNGDIVSDFVLNSLGLSLDDSYKPENNNPSLNSFQVSLKRKLNEMVNENSAILSIPFTKLYKRFPSIHLSSDNREKFSVSRALQDDIYCNYLSSNIKFFKKFIPGEDFHGKYVDGKGISYKVDRFDVIVYLKELAGKTNLYSNKELVDDYAAFACRSDAEYKKLYERKVSSHQMLDVMEISKRVEDAYSKGEPFSFVRAGDGEGNATVIDFMPYCQKASSWQIDKIFRLMFGKEKICNERKIDICLSITHALKCADVLGIPSPTRIPLSSKMEELEVPNRGAFGLYSLGLFLSQLLEEDRSFSSCYAHVEDINQWKSLLCGKNIVLISCHDELPMMLQSKIGCTVVDFLKIPPQASGVEGSFESNHATQVFTSIVEDIEGHKHLKNCIFVVGAGILGKIYCNVVRNSGGISLDLGSLLDVWVGKSARTYQQSESFKNQQL